MPRDNHILNFLDAEANINDSELYEPKDEYINHELAAADRKAKKEIRHLEAEIQKWQVLVDKVRGDNPPDFDNQTLAVLRGRLVRYLMRSKEVIETLYIFYRYSSLLRTFGFIGIFTYIAPITVWPQPI